MSEFGMYSRRYNVYSYGGKDLRQRKVSGYFI